VNDYVNVPDSNSLDATTFTLTAWFKNSKPDSQIISARIASKKTNWDDRNGWSIELNGANDNIAGGATTLGSSGTNGTVKMMPAWDNAWHHIAVVCSGSTATLYLDGSAKGTAAITAVTANNVALAIGRLQAGSDYFAGTIDEVKFYNSALTASQVTTDYASVGSQLLHRTRLRPLFL